MALLSTLRFLAVYRQGSSFKKHSSARPTMSRVCTQTWNNVTKSPWRTPGSPECPGDPSTRLLTGLAVTPNDQKFPFLARTLPRFSSEVLRCFMLWEPSKPKKRGCWPGASEWHSKESRSVWKAEVAGGRSSSGLHLCKQEPPPKWGCRESGFLPRAMNCWKKYTLL